MLYWTRRIRGLAYDGSTIRAHARAVFGDALDGSGLSNSTPLGKRPKLWEVQLGVSQQTRGWEIVRVRTALLAAPVKIADIVELQPISARYVINGDDPIFGVEEFGQLPYPVTSRTAATPWSTMCRLLPSLRRPPCPDNTSNCSRPLPTTINRDIQLLVPILMPTPPTLPSEYVSDSTQQLPPPVFCLGLANLNYPHPTRDAHFEEDGDDEEGKASPTHQVSELPVPWLPPHRALSRSLLPSRSFS